MYKNMNINEIIEMNKERLLIGVCYDDIIFPSLTNKLITKDLKQICDVKRVRKNQREAQQLQKKYDELNLNIKFYSPDNKSRVNVYTLKTDVEQKYKDIGTDPINYSGGYKATI